MYTKSRAVTAVSTGLAAAVMLGLAGCATTPRSPDATFFSNVKALCGKAFEGRVVTTDAADADMAGKRLVMHVRECSDERIRIPFHVGEDRSRTWVLTPLYIIVGRATKPGGHFWLGLKHDHRHEDGSLDVLTNYGGESHRGGTAARLEFPADAFSKELFAAKGNPASAANVWAMEIAPGRSFAYELRRPNRHFRVEFDLTRPVPAPPPPWGAR